MVVRTAVVVVASMVDRNLRRESIVLAAAVVVMSS